MGYQPSSYVLPDQYTSGLNHSPEVTAAPPVLRTVPTVGGGGIDGGDGGVDGGIDGGGGGGDGGGVYAEQMHGE